MDAPEGFVLHPLTGKLYVAMTENKNRTPSGKGDAPERVNAANPRGPNPPGHILLLVPPGHDDVRDSAAEVFDRDVFALCGNPARAEDAAMFHPGTTIGRMARMPTASPKPAPSGPIS